MDSENRSRRLVTPSITSFRVSRRCSVKRSTIFIHVLVYFLMQLLLIHNLAQNVSLSAKTKPTPYVFLQFLAMNGFNGPSDKVQVFLTNSKKLNPSLEPILLEPLYLERVLLEEERSLLVKRKLMPKIKTPLSFEDGIQLITFGIFSQSLAQFIPNLKEICKQWVGFKCEAVYSQKKSKSTPNKVASHVFLLKKNTLIHLVVLFQRNHFLRIEAVPQNKRKPFGIRIKDHLSFGTKEQAFDSFSIRKVEMPFDEATVSVPEDSDHLLAQMDSSEFIECNRPSYEEEFPPISLSDFERRAERGIIQMNYMMKQVKVPIWIAAGTLLGWYRECGIIGHTTDVDFATWSEFATSDINALIKSVCPEPRLFQIFGVFEDGYEMSFATHDGLKLDLFYVYQESETTVKMSSHIVRDRKYAYYYYPKFELCSGDLLGYKVLVPCNPESVIMADYGPNWTQPVTEWSYYESAFNMGPMKKWTHDRPQYQSFKCHLRDV